MARTLADSSLLSHALLLLGLSHITYSTTVKSPVGNPVDHRWRDASHIDDTVVNSSHFAQSVLGDDAVDHIATITEPKSVHNTEDHDWSQPSLCLEQYCVYHHPGFANGQGIVIISHPHVADDISEMPVFKELASSKISTLEFIMSEGINQEATLAQTEEITGKGRGLVAKRHIGRGQRIMAHTPVILVQRQFVDELPVATQIELFLEGVERLPALTRQLFWQQAGQSADSESSILDIVMNNSFDMLLDTASGQSETRGVPHRQAFFGNFPRVSMYNHDCRPSVAFYFDHASLVHYTHASRSIPAGEELSISYVNPFRTGVVRRDRAQRNWGFTCACAMCSLPSAQANASDNRLARIHDLERQLEDIGGQTSVKVDADTIELFLSLYEQEGLLKSHGATAYELAAVNYNSLGRAELATKYGLLALEAHIIQSGQNTPRVKSILGLLDEPTQHRSWKKRMTG